MSTIPTPLRAEPIEIDNAPRLIDSWAIRDANGKLVCHCYSKETAAAIVGMSEQNEHLRAALDGMIRLYESKWSDAPVELATAKAALAAGGEKV